jgi:carbamoyltransferase
MRVLGISFSGHGSSMCLVENGKIACALNLDRLTRRKHSLVALPGCETFMQNIAMQMFRCPAPPSYFNFYEVFPLMLNYVTGTEHLSEAEIDLVVKTPDNIGPYFGKPDAIQSHHQTEYLKLRDFFGSIPTYLDFEHHLGHAYQAFLCSPFDEAAVLTIDGMGENLPRLGLNSLTTTLCRGSNNRIQVLEEVMWPSSVGGIFSNFTRHVGFAENQEGKTMALAAYGCDDFYRRYPGLLRLCDRGRFELPFNDDWTNLKLLDCMQEYCSPRAAGAEITQEHCNLAWAAQRYCEEAMVHSVRYLSSATGLTRLTIAGGVGLNCVANGKLLEETPMREIYVMPNAGDAGISAGCALFGYHVWLGQNNRCPPDHDYLGRSYPESEIFCALKAASNIRYHRSPDICGEVAQLIEKGNIIGWLQDGAEFGPRALGNRSILADPRRPESKIRLDRDIKRREVFRPYAPSVLWENYGEYFALSQESPYMLIAANVRAKVAANIPAVVHVDGSARVQTVKREANSRYHRLIEEFFRRTGVPMVLNTSFNSNGEPIVETPQDGLHDLFDMHLDALAIGDYLVHRENTSVEQVRGPQT